jgi:hypothetical protein
MTSLLRFFLGRRLARALPGGWLLLLLLDPRSRAFAQSIWRRGRTRRSRA